MLFNSLTFAMFLPIVFTLYWLLDRHYRVQNVLLLVASYVFYGWWDWRFLFLIVACTATNFISGLIIYGSKSNLTRRLMLVVCCIVCLGALCVFKYYNFFAESFACVLGFFGVKVSPLILNIGLPVGISFFTFQALSYTIDVMLGKLRPTKDWVEFFVFISFFPQLVAGPIERAGNLLPQFQKTRKFDLQIALHGICLLCYGLFKKMVVADNLSAYVDKVWLDPMFYSSITCLIGAIFFALQIYCDFSGYSDVARGVAKLLGFELTLNFDRPYLSHTFSEFWRRWHISLSTWFKDYVYIPLGGNRVPFMRMIWNLWIVFLLSGLWHGASWAFVAWGALHALYLTLGVVRVRLFGKYNPANTLGSMWSMLVVNVGVVIAWILFRSGTLKDAIAYFRALFCCKFDTSLMALCAGIGPVHFAFCVVAACLLLLSYLTPRDCRFKSVLGCGVFSAICVAAIVFLGMPSGGEFIYFRF